MYAQSKLFDLLKTNSPDKENDPVTWGQALTCYILNIAHTNILVNIPLQIDVHSSSKTLEFGGIKQNCRQQLRCEYSSGV